MKRNKVCVVGSGGREHALQFVLSHHADVVVTPGNPGIPGSISDKPEDIDADLFVIGPEAPLVDGLADRLRAQGKLVFGPGADGAQLEGSKAWMKDLLTDAGVPTAAYRVVKTDEEASNALTWLEWLDDLDYPGWVIKTDGLAAGKGTTVTRNREAAMRDVRAKLSGRMFGDAGKALVIEGELASASGAPVHEVSIFAVCNGTEDYVLLEGAQDYKRLSADSDLMTGGMGAYSPTRDQDKLAEWAEITIRPTLRALRSRGIDYRGVLYAGLMIVDGKPYVLEFNIRFGDPEAEVILPRITNNLVETLMQAATGEPMGQVSFSKDIAVARVLCAENYPDKPRTGDAIRMPAIVINGPGDFPALQADAMVFLAGVSQDQEGQLITAGGRVLVVVSIASSPEKAIRSLDREVSLFSWPGMHSRTDIGQELLVD